MRELWKALHAEAKEEPGVRPGKRMPAQVVASAAIGRRLEVGPRLTLKGNPDPEILGEALHNIFAADLIDPNHAGRGAMAIGVLESHGLSGNVAADDVLACTSRFQGCLHETFKPISIRPEWPVTMVLDNGQRMNGWIDVLVDTEEGWVIIDHKSFPGGKNEWDQKVLSYSGQLEAYRRAVIKATERPVISQWIHFSVGGGTVEVMFNQA